MKRSILSHFALFSTIAFAIAVCVSLVVSLWYGINDVVRQFHGYATLASEESRMLFRYLTFDDISLKEYPETYKQLRSELRELCMTHQAEYMYLYSVDPDTGVRTFLFCVATKSDEDKVVQEQRHFGSQSSKPLSKQELAAVKGAVSDTAERTSNEYGSVISWYFPFELEGVKNPVVLGVDFDVEDEQQDVWRYVLSFAVPLLVVTVLIVTVELVALKRVVLNPLHMLSDRMRSFTKDGAQSKEHIAEGNIAEMADIEDSFNQMTDDIDSYVKRIAQMTEEHATAEAELEVARRIQLGLVPPTTHCSSNGFDAYAFERTARAVGGDFYDLAERDDGKLVCVIADVSGKGVSAALFMAMFRTLVSSKLQAYMDPARALNKANDIVVLNNPECMFVTLIAAVYDPTTRTLTYANAGHTPPLMIGGTYLSPDEGIALGLFEDAGIVNETLTLNPGEGILFYTDGATEAVDTNNAFYGEERLMQQVRDTQDARSAIRAAVDGIDAFAGEREQFDDLTLLALFATDTDTDQQSWHATLEPELSSFGELREHIMALFGTNSKAKQAVLACDEAFANVVNYSGATFVEVELEATTDGFVVRMADDGTPFDPLSYEAQDHEFEDFDMGGMGIMFMREASDKVAYEYVDNKNVLTLRFES